MCIIMSCVCMNILSLSREVFRIRWKELAVCLLSFVSSFHQRRRRRSRIRFVIRLTKLFFEDSESVLFFFVFLPLGWRLYVSINYVFLYLVLKYFAKFTKLFYHLLTLCTTVKFWIFIPKQLFARLTFSLYINGYINLVHLMLKE